MQKQKQLNRVIKLVKKHGILRPRDLDAQGIPIDPTYAGQLFGIGNFFAALITFIIVAFVIFVIVKVTTKWGIK